MNLFILIDILREWLEELRELDDTYDNLSTNEICNKESDLRGLYKTMEELLRKLM